MEINNFVSELEKRSFSLTVEDGKLILQGDKNRLTNEQIESIKNDQDIIGFIRANREALIRYVSETAGVFNQEQQREISAMYRLSGLQEGMLFHGLYDANAGVYTQQFSCEFQGLDEDLFRQSWQYLLRQHSILRTGFNYDEFKVPVQYVHTTVALPLTIIDYSNYEPAEKERLTEEYAIADRHKGFDFSFPPLMRISLIRMTASRHRMLWTWHHILFDGWSVPLLNREFLVAYLALSAGKALPTRYEDRYEDYIRYIEKQNKEKDLHYWKHYLDGAADGCFLPFIAGSADRNKGIGVYKDKVLKLDATLTDRIESFAQRHHLTVNTIMQGAWALLLHHYTGLDHVLYGITVSGRPDDLPDIEQRVGMYINTLPLHETIDAEKHTTAWLQEIQADQVRSREHQLTSLNDIRKWMEVEHDLFDTTLTFQNYPVGQMIADGATALQVRNIELHQHNNYPLTLTITAADGISITFSYNTLLLSDTYIDEIATHITQVLDQITHDAGGMLKDIDVITPAGYERLLFEFNNTTTALPADKMLTTLFCEQARRTPDSLAIICQDRTMTYRELDEQSDLLSHYLISMGVKKDTIVPLCMPRGWEMPVAILGVLKAGGAFAPIDPAYPEHRINFILKDTSAWIVISTTEYAGKLDANPYIHVTTLEAATHEPAPVTQPTPPDPHQLAYIIYTSGSTGNPKGVMIEHLSLLNYLSNSRTKYVDDQKGGSYIHLSYTFDAALTALFMPLLSGKPLVISTSEPAEVFNDPLFFRHAPYDFIKLTPSHMPLLEIAMQDMPGKEVARRLVLGGEALKPHHVKFLTDRKINCDIINEYGPTEATVGCTTYVFNTAADRIADGQPIPIGQPVDNTTIYILDRNKKLVPVGVFGELYIGGAGLARAYFNLPELTEDRFTTVTLHGGKPERLYRTGDRARWLPDGNLEYAGRLDDQLKINGYRIEPGEIENALLRSGWLKQAVVLPKADQDGRSYLVAFIVLQDNVSKDDIRTDLEERLPEYMIPSWFVELKTIPLTVNGKIDKKTLLDIDPRGDNKQELTLPATPTEEALAVIWQTVLEDQEIGTRDSFFNIGGDSIKSIRLVSKLKDKFPMNITLSDFFEHDTIEKMGAFIDAQIAGAGTAAAYKAFEEKVAEIREEKLKTMPDAGTVSDIYPMKDIQKGMLFSSLMYPDLPMYHDQFVYRVVQPGFQIGIFRKALSLLVQKHTILRTRFGDGQGEEDLQIVMRSVPVRVDHIDLRQHPAAEQKKIIREYMQEERKRPFNLMEAPLWRATVFNTDDNTINFLWQFHHAILDGWSTASFNTELNNTYVALKNDPDFIPAMLHSDNRTAVIEELVEKNDEENIQFWKNELYEYKRLDIFSDTMTTTAYSKGYDFAYISRLREVARNNDVSIKSLLFSGYLFALKMLTFEDELTVGVVTHNRPLAEDGDKILGCFVNTVPVRYILKGSGGMTWRDYLKNVDRKLLDVKKRERVTLFEITDIAAQKSDEKNSFFDTLFNFADFHIFNDMEEEKTSDGAEGQNATTEGSSQQPRERQEIYSYELTNTFLDVTANVTGQSLHMHYILRRTFKSAVSLESLHGYFEKIMDCYLHHSDEPISQERLFSTTEQQLLTAYNDTAKEYPSDKTIVTLLEEQIARTPDDIAIVMEDRRITYAEMNRQANQLAHYLLKMGIRQESLIPVCMNRSPEIMIVILAIFKTGAAYTPLDPLYPADRIRYMLDDTNADLIISDLPCRHLVSEKEGARVICREEHLEELNKESAENPAIDIPLDGLAYMIYTSGSTGKPKGAMIEHRGMVNHMYAKINDLTMTSRSILAQNASQSFDISIWQFYAPLLVGGHTVIYDNDIVFDATRFMEQLSRDGVTILEVVPSYLTMLLEMAEITDHTRYFIGMEYMIVNGEVLKPILVERWFKLFPSIKMINAYGATEASDDTNHYFMDGPMDVEVLPIGLSPVQNMQIYIVDALMNQCPPGVKGEIAMAGIGIGRGYWNKKEQTEKVFLKDPFLPQAGFRLYKTGDLGRITAKGELEFFGRKDNQVKVRGFRIELEEIEVVIGSYPLVQDAVVLVRQTAQGEAYLSSYLVIKPGFELDSFREYLSEKLPEYMIPGYFTIVDAFPLNNNGKTDRTAMKAWQDDKIEKFTKDHIAPRTDLEKKLTGIWTEVLQTDQIGITDNFFELGGDSFKAIRMVARSGRDFSVPDLYKNPTIERLAAFIHKQGPGKGFLYELTPPGANRQLAIIAVPNSAGDPIIYQQTADTLQTLTEDYAMFGVNLPRTEPAPDEDMQSVLQNLAKEIVAEIKVKIPGSIILYGQCNGSGLALELATLLQEEGMPCKAVCFGAALANKRMGSENDRRTDQQISGLLDMIDAPYPRSTEDQAIFFRNFKYDSNLATAAYNRALSSIKNKTYKKIQAPVFCIVGDKDPLTKNYASKYKDWKHFAEGVELIVMNNVGHFMWRDQPAELAHIIYQIAGRPLQPAPAPKRKSIFAR